jgi:hypothetical protein
MSVLRKFRCPWRAVSALAGGLALSGCVFARPSLAAPPRYPDIMPLSKIKPGMTGYGLTTFKGTTISRFQVTVIGILPKANDGHDMILIRMKGGPITERGAYLIHGMSGSPIYINGKVVGAFAMGEQFPREPIGMVTPIEDMLEAWDPNIPQQPNYYMPADKLPAAPTQGGVPANKVSLLDRARLNRENTIVLPQPILVGDRRITRLVVNARPDDHRPSTPDTAMLHRATSLLSVSGLNERDRQWFQQELDRRGYALTVMSAPGMSARGKNAIAFRGAPLRPGSAFGTWLSTGDVQVGGTGTITYRRGDRVLGFGHPLMGLGALNAAVSSAYVLDIFPGLDTSHHIAVPGPVIGTLRQDRDFSVSAELGAMPQMVPFDITVRDHTTLRTQTFHSRVFQNPDLTAVLLRLVAKNVIAQVHNVPGDAMAHVTTTVEAGEVGKVTRSNIAFDPADIATTATSDLSDITNVVSGNPFYPLPIKAAHMTVDISNGHNTATVERIFLKQGKYEPGDTLDIGVIIKPYRREPLVRNISLKIPADTPSGRYALLVRGGTAQVTRVGPFILSSSSSDPQTPPVNVRQMINRLNQHEQNTDLVARLILNTVAPALEGEKLSQLPPNLAMLMRSDRNSGVRLERDELRTVAPTDYVVSGTQQLVVTVQRKNTQEPTGGGNYTGSQPSTLPGSRSPFDGGGNGLIGASASGEETPDANDQNNQSARWSGEVQRWMNAAGARPEHLKQRFGQTEGAETSASGDDDTPEEPQTKPDAKPAGKQAASGKQTARDAKQTGGSAQTSTPPADTPITASAAPPPAQDTANDKPVGRQLRTWRQTASADFGAGKFNGASVTANGELRLAPRLRRLASTGEIYIWSLATDSQGNLYAGTGTGGKILKVDPQGQVTTFASLPVISVQTLLMGRDGLLWAGSGVKGNLYRIQPNGAFTAVATLPEKYILALAQDSKGNLYIAPGGGGTVYRIRAEQQSAATVRPEPYLKTSADHIMALAVDAKDNLYAGTGNDGILYKVTPDGKTSVLYDAKENSITALAADANGNVYAGTGPKGLLYRIAPDGTATVIYDRATSFFTALRPASDGTFYAATVNTVYHIHPSQDPGQPDVVHSLDNPRDVDFLTLGVLPGGVAAGTGNVGEIYTSIPETSDTASRAGIYESVVHDAHNLSRWGALHVEVLLPAGASLSDVRAETRSGNVAEPDATWSDWAPVGLHGAADPEGKINSPEARFIQYRLTLSGGKSSSGGGPTSYNESSPGVRSVSISYMPRNQAPRVVFQSPLGGERWSKTQAIRWNGSDPDNDTLTYDLFLSADGVNWRPLPTGGKSILAGASAATQAAMPDSLKQMLEANSSQKTLSGGIANNWIGSLRVTSKSWDTNAVPDGTYRLKVMATDRASNPVDAQIAEVISEPFVICNTPPSVTLSPAPTVASDKTVTITGAAIQSMIAVAAVQYRVDGGEWVAAVPKDGLFDSPQESFTATTQPLASGKHTIEVEVFNTAGGRSSQKLEVQVP